MAKSLTNYIPLLQDLKNYNYGFLRADLFAGATVAFILIPQAIAYSFLAGMPPVYGLFAGLIPLAIYAILGTSRNLSIGPVAINAILLFSGLKELETPFSENYVSLAITTGLLVGLLQLIIGVFRFGFLVNFLSHPVISGFISGAAVIIIWSQLKLFIYADGVVTFHLPTIIMGLVAGALILLQRKFLKRIPGPLIVIILSIIITSVFKLYDDGVLIIGDIPNGLPSFVFPEISLSSTQSLIPVILTVGLMGIVECISIAKSIELKQGQQNLNVNQELIAIGASKIGGSMFQAMPSSASFSRSAISIDSGGKTGVASLVTSTVIAVVLLFFTDYLYHLPMSILAVIIILSVIRLIDIKEIIRLWSVRKRDFATLLATFLVTLIFGIETGVLTGVILSFMLLLYTSSKPHATELGKIQNSSHYRNVDRFDNLIMNPKVVILRYDDQLYFGNADYFKEFIIASYQKRKSRPAFILIDFSNVHDLDSTGLRALKDVHEYLVSRNSKLLLCSVRGPVRDVFKKSGYMVELGDRSQFLNIGDAIRFIENPKDYEPKSEVLQSNK